MDLLIKGKTYVLGVIGNGLISHSIQMCSHCDLPIEDRFSHVASLFWHWHFNQWVIVESHIDSGVCIKTFVSWFNENKDKRIIGIPYHVSPNEIMKYLGRPYGFRDIYNLAKYQVLKSHLLLRGDGMGIYCSELIALSDNRVITTELNKPSNEIKPVDFQLRAINNNIPMFNVNQFLLDCQPNNA